MSLEADNYEFQKRYYLVGNGVVVMPRYVGVEGSEASFKMAGLHLPSSSTVAARKGARSSAWLFRVFGHVKSAVVTHRDIEIPCNEA